MTTVDTDEQLIRELGGAAFETRYGCDRFTATVLGNRLEYIVEHMCRRLLTAAFSPILRDFYDFAAVITGPEKLGYLTPAMSNSLVLFTGTMTDSVRVSVQEYGPHRLAPGDVIVANDPYRTGTHVNDMLFIRPVFHDGRLLAYVSLKAHQLDMGGTVPGGFSVMKRNVYENGLVLSPRALLRGGELVPETWSLIFDNVRFGEILLPDMRTICAELELGERLLRETAHRYGTHALHGAMTYVCDASAERMRQALLRLPDGVYEGSDLMDCDGVDDSESYLVRVRVHKHAGRVEVDFSGSSRQARTCVNATPLDAKTTVGVALKYLLDPQGPFTSGLFQDIDLVIPDGTVVSALPPDGAVFAFYEQNQVIMSAMLRALQHAVGQAAMAGDSGCTDIHNASGVRTDGSPWLSVAECGGEIGPFGANAHGDADSQMLSYQANGIAVAAETVETSAPVVVLRHEIVPDSGGPGRHRGGAALDRDTFWRLPAQHNFMSLRYKQAPGFGVIGGGDGRTGGVWVWDGASVDFTGLPLAGPDSFRDATPLGGVLDPHTNAPDPAGEYVFPFRVPSWQTPAGTVLRVRNNGGGGWGDPLERDVEKVRKDVRDGYVTVQGAARDYGVVITGDPDNDPENLVIDAGATNQLRTEMAKERE
ncbi:hydantoinase B/oxoprolinase family protein [Streptomyces sp. NPDC055955]|uniref:hydantoinase B/oxoprolinase family protein n=1 Tax=Streptomyces sp. NPDC055955 TaxID=3345665 RepID=UPI0035E322BA